MGAAGGAAAGEAVSVGPPEQGERWERSARFWMRAYPARWRVARGEELLGVLLDLAAPGARRVGARTAVDLVRGGWATRWREHPPFWAWIAYRTFGRRLPDPYRAWAKDDIDGVWWAVRGFAYLPSSWVILVNTTLSWPDRPQQWSGLLVGLILFVWLFTSDVDRRRATRKHVDPQPGERLYGGRLVVRDGLRPRIDARSGLRWLAAVTGLLAAGSVATVAAAPLGTWVHRAWRAPGVDGGFRWGTAPVVDRTPAVVVVLLGVCLAVIAVRRVRRLLPPSVDQPNRLLRPLGRLVAARILVVTLVGGVALWFEATGRIIMLVSPVLAAVMVVLLAGALAGMVELRRTGASQLAVVDVLRAALLGRAPEADGPVPVLGRAVDAQPYDDVPVRAFGGRGSSTMPA